MYMVIKGCRFVQGCEIIKIGYLFCCTCLQSLHTINSDLVLAPVLVNEREREFVLDVWVGGQQVRGTGEGQRGGVVCSKQENEAV